MLNWLKNLASGLGSNLPNGESPPRLQPTEESASFKKEGDAFLLKGNLDEAEACYRSAISLDQNNAKAHSNLGYVLKELGDLNDAEHRLQTALSIDPEIADAHYMLGTIFQSRGQLESALHHFHKTLESDPTHEFANRDLCFILFENGKIEAAKEAIAKGIAHNPSVPDYHYYLGNLHAHTGELDKAAACYTAALSIHPAYVEVYFHLGMVLQQQGNPGEAIANYQKAIAIKPDYAEALNNLGVSLMDLGRPDEAESCYRRALQINPEYTEAHNNLGAALQSMARFVEAEASYRSAVQLTPDHAKAHVNLGNVLIDLGQQGEAEASYRRALQITPDFADAHNNLGATLKNMGRFVEAEACYRRAIQARPDHADAHNNLGNVLTELHRLDEAEASCRRALQIKPDHIDAHSNLGRVLTELHRLDEAEATYRQALQFNPNHAETHFNLGFTLMEQGRRDEAKASYLHALRIKPNYADPHNNLGVISQSMGRFVEAEGSYQKALREKPDHAEAHNNLGNTRKDLGRLDEAEASYRQALLIRPSYADAHSNLIFTMDLMFDKNTASLQEERKRWDTAQTAHLHLRQTHSNNPDPARRLRIGYVSADFREHSAIRVFGGMLTQFDRSQFDVYAYANHKGKDDRFTSLFKQNVTAWRNISRSADDAVEKMILEDQIDILVDLSGHSAGNRLLVFARKPAPIQITAWGYATSTGMRAMDVFFADPVVVPPEDKHYFTEEVRYLPSVVGAFFNEPFPDVNELPALSNGIITFGSFNRLAKVSDASFCAWAEVLQAVPRSRLILKTAELDDASNRERVIGHFTNAGIAAERIVLQGRTSWHQHIQAYNQIDLALDPFPHGGGVTALEGLMMGIPAIVLRWPTVTGSTSAAIMTALGLTEWIAKTREQYVELAVQKTKDLHSLAALRQQLRTIFTSSVMGDQVAYARAVEQEYRKLWGEWCDRQRAEWRNYDSTAQGQY